MVGAAALALGRRRRRGRWPRPRRRARSAQGHAATRPTGSPSRRPSWRPRPPTTTSTSSATNKDDPARLAASLKPRPWTVQVDGLVRQAQDVRHRGDAQDRAARGAHLLAPLRRGVVDGDPVDRLPARRLAQAGGADGAGEVRGVHHADGSRAVPRPEAGASSARLARLALHRGAPAGRGDAPAHAAHRRDVRPGAAQSERRARCASSSRGSTASRAPSRSSASA